MGQVFGVAEEGAIALVGIGDRGEAEDGGGGIGIRSKLAAQKGGQFLDREFWHGSRGLRGDFFRGGGGGLRSVRLGRCDWGGSWSFLALVLIEGGHHGVGKFVSIPRVEDDGYAIETWARLIEDDIEVFGFDTLSDDLVDFVDDSRSHPDGLFLELFFAGLLELPNFAIHALEFVGFFVADFGFGFFGFFAEFRFSDLFVDFFDFIERLFGDIHPIFEFFFGAVAGLVDFGFGVLGFIIGLKNFLHIDRADFDVLSGSASGTDGNGEEAEEDGFFHSCLVVVN